MKTTRSHKIQLKPNNKQKTYFAKTCGVARFTYNWALAYSKSEYEAGKPIAWRDIKVHFNAIKRESYPFVLEVTKCAPEQAIRDLGTAYKNFWGGRNKHPKFHKKGVNDSFYIANDQFKLEGKKVRIPKLGWVNMTEQLRFEGKILSATVSRKADKWFISITVELEAQEPKANNSAIGIDLGINVFAVTSEGKFIYNPKSYKAQLAKLRMLNKQLSRQTRYSKNWKKTKLKLQKLHKQTADIRLDFLHKLTSGLAEQYGHIFIEDLNVGGMLKSDLGRSLSDQGFGKFRELLAYKAQNLIIIDRWYPSSKTCSGCGVVHDLPRSARKMSCECGLSMNRDLNAARNILIEGIKTVGSTGLDYRLASSGLVS